MDAFFIDSAVERHPPEAVRLLDLRAEPLPDGRRIRLTLELTPFQKSPTIELSLSDPAGQPCAAASIVEPMGWKMDFTLHIRSEQPAPGTYTLNAVLSYPDLGETDRRQISVEVPAPSDT